jgi:hypothetical protein
MAAFLLPRVHSRLPKDLVIEKLSNWEIEILGCFGFSITQLPNSPIIEFPHGCMSLIKTTSESVCPRTIASCLPSNDQWKS